MKSALPLITKAALATYDDALATLLAAAGRMDSESVGLGEAFNRVLAQPLVAQISSPRCDVSAMDGYAVADADLGPEPVSLQIRGASFPGLPTDCVAGSGQSVRIFTGAPMPRCADRVIIQEDVARSGTTALFPALCVNKTHVRRQGSDFEAGDVLIPNHTRLKARHLLVAAAADAANVQVARRPRVAIIATGDELVQAGLASSQSQALPESIMLSIATMVFQWGGISTERTIVSDDLVAIIGACQDAAADVIVLCGGASAGERDSSRAAVAALGLDPLFAGVSIKPGKPVWAGMLGTTCVIGLPGNPIAAFVMARLMLIPLVAVMTGVKSTDALNWQRLPVAKSLPANGSREAFLLAQSTPDDVEISARQDSSAQILLSTANALARRASFAPSITAGTFVQVLAL